MQAQLKQRQRSRDPATVDLSNEPDIDLTTYPDDLLAEQRASIAELVSKHAPRGVMPHQRGRYCGRGAYPDANSLAIWQNPKSQPGCPLYERFISAWAEVPDKGMRLVFHGTPEENIHSICREGLDPRRRSGQAHGPGEYFGGNMATSMGYCRGGRHMLIFAVLLDNSGVTAIKEDNSAAIVVINKPQHQLPLGVVTLSGAPYAPPAGWVDLPDPQRFFTEKDAPPPQSAASHLANAYAAAMRAFGARGVAPPAWLAAASGYQGPPVAPAWTPAPSVPKATGKRKRRR